jgi:hypothetical protein
MRTCWKILVGASIWARIIGQVAVKVTRPIAGTPRRRWATTGTPVQAPSGQFLIPTRADPKQVSQALWAYDDHPPSAPSSIAARNLVGPTTQQ